jgi:conjugative coupling factor TraD (TOL family)
MRPYVLSTTKLPVSYRRLFLGLGFEWSGKHAQRLADLERVEGRKYKESSAVYRWARRFEAKHEHALFFRVFTAVLNAIDQLLEKYRWFPLFLALQYVLRNNPLVALPPVGGAAALHAVGLYEGETPVYMDLRDRVGHTLVLGTTRVGKSRLAELLIAQDIHRGDVVIVFDPKGDADLFMRMYVEAKRAGRLDNFYFFHLGYPEISARYNPVGSFTRITEVAGRIADQLPGEGQSAAFREFVWRYVNVIAKALTALGRKVDYEQIKDYGQDIEPLVRDYLEMTASQADPQGAWRHRVKDILEAYRDSDNKEYRVPREMASRDLSVVALWRYCKDQGLFDSVAASLARTYEYERGYFDKLVSSLLPLMEKLTTGSSAALLSPDYLDDNEPRPIFDWSQIIRAKGIVYIGLDALTNPEVASTVGNAMFSDLTSMSGRLYIRGIDYGMPDIGSPNNVTVNIHADEFNELIGDEFIPLLNKAGGAGFQVTAYTQTWSDVEARLNNKAKAGQIAGNFNTLIMLRVRELATAKMLTEHLRKVEINHLTDMSRAMDSSDPDSPTHFTSGTEQRKTTQQVELIHPNDVIQLPKGQCFAMLDGGRPYKIRLPLADKRDFDGCPKDLRVVSEEMRERYTTSETWYHFTPSWNKAA